MIVPFLDLENLHQEVADELFKAWANVLETSSFVGGPFVEALEWQWAEYCETSHAVGVANGTDALRLTLQALGIGLGDEVVVPANTFIATAAAVAEVGAVPIFVDVDPETLLMTPRHLAEAITPRTAAAIPVHLYGQPVDMPGLMSVAEKAGIVVVEDAAQAHGARWNGRRVGSFGHAACFSFYPGKNLGALGDGGAVVTNDPGLAERVRQLANHGRGADKYTHDVVGSNSRLDGLQAAILSVKIAHLDRWNEARRQAAASYRHLLSGLPLTLTAERREAESVHHLMVVRTEDRDGLRSGMHESGIGVGLHYPIPCHRQHAFSDLPERSLPVAEEAARRLLSLPMFPHITETQIGATVRAIESHFEGKEARDDG
jgi:dTDP-4-amino-4,6-dideoxygalactose transaminase